MDECPARPRARRTAAADRAQILDGDLERRPDRTGESVERRPRRGTGGVFRRLCTEDQSGLDSPGEVLGQRARREKSRPARTSVAVTGARVHPRVDVGTVSMTSTDVAEPSQQGGSREPSRRGGVTEIGVKAGVGPVLGTPHQAGVDGVEVNVPTDAHQVTPKRDGDATRLCNGRELRAPLKIREGRSERGELRPDEKVVMAREEAERVNVDGIPDTDVVDAREEGPRSRTRSKPGDTRGRLVHDVMPSRAGRNSRHADRSGREGGTAVRIPGPAGPRRQSAFVEGFLLRNPGVPSTPLDAPREVPYPSAGFWSASSRTETKV